jgi:type IV pilus assembly protein PilA
MPASSEGEDYNTGGPSGGWKCLRFDMGRPQYYQYHYNAGGDYVTDNPNLPRGEGFEAAAKGDIDGDGTESSFSTVGKIEGTTLSRSYDVFLEDEFE